MKSDKKNPYKKIGLFMLLSAAGGAVVGLLGIFVLDSRIDSIKEGIAVLILQIQRGMLPAMLIITAGTVIFGEINLRRQKSIGSKIREAEDEECDRWEYEEERAGAYGVLANILSQVLCVLVLSAGYSIKYIENNHHRGILLTCLVFLACYVYDSFWQVRYVRVIQSSHPEKKGDLSSRRFQQQWLESCDEAEREMIYQSAYKSYLMMSRWIPILLVATMLGHLFFDTGIAAIVVVAVVWLVLTMSYLGSCVELRGKKIR